MSVYSGATPGSSIFPTAPNVGDTLSWSFAIYYPGVVTYYYSVSGPLPPGITFNTNTGLLAGVFTTAGTYNFTVFAGFGTSFSHYTWTVIVGSGTLVGSIIPVPALGTCEFMDGFAHYTGANTLSGDPEMSTKWSFTDIVYIGTTFGRAGRSGARLGDNTLWMNLADGGQERCVGFAYRTGAFANQIVAMGDGLYAGDYDRFNVTLAHVGDGTLEIIISRTGLSDLIVLIPSFTMTLAPDWWHFQLYAKILSYDTLAIVVRVCAGLSTSYTEIYNAVLTLPGVFDLTTRAFNLYQPGSPGGGNFSNIADFWITDGAMAGNQQIDWIQTIGDISNVGWQTNPSSPDTLWDKIHKAHPLADSNFVSQNALNDKFMCLMQPVGPIGPVFAVQSLLWTKKPNGGIADIVTCYGEPSLADVEGATKYPGSEKCVYKFNIFGNPQLPWGGTHTVYQMLPKPGASIPGYTREVLTNSPFTGQSWNPATELQLLRMGARRSRIG